MRNYLVIIFIALCGILIYLPSISNNFIWDDHIIIEQNSSIRAPSILWIWTHPFLPPGFAQEQNIYYRPMTIFSFWSLYKIFGESALFFRLFLLLSHFLAILLVYKFSRKFLNFNAAIVAMASFALNPVHTESVCFPSAVSDILVAIFVLIAFIVYISKNKSGIFIAPSIWLFALFAKENAAVGIFAIVIYDILFRKELKFKDKIFRWSIWIIYSIIYFALRINALGGFEIAGASLVPFWKRILFAPYFLLRYILNVFLPFDIKVLHPEVMLKMNYILSFVGIIGVVILGIFIVYIIKKKDKISLFGFSWIIIFLLPVLGIASLSNALWADRFLYVPSIGAGFLFGLLWEKYGAKSPKSIPRLSKILLAGYFLFLMFSSIIYAFDWRNDNILFSRMTEDAPMRAIGFSGKSGIFATKNMPDSAYYYIEKAIALEPNYLPALIIMAQLQMQKENLDSAKFYLDKAVTTYPNYVYCYSNLGIYWIYIGDTTLATKYFIMAHRIAPHDYIVNKNLGVAMISLGDTIAGLEYLERACEYYPEGTKAQFELLNFYYSVRDTVKMKEMLDKYPQLWQFIRKQ